MFTSATLLFESKFHNLQLYIDNIQYQIYRTDRNNTRPALELPHFIVSTLAPSVRDTYRNMTHRTHDMQYRRTPHSRTSLSCSHELSLNFCLISSLNSIISPPSLQPLRVSHFTTSHYLLSF